VSLCTSSINSLRRSIIRSSPPRSIGSATTFAYGGSAADGHRFVRVRAEGREQFSPAAVLHRSRLTPQQGDCFLPEPFGATGIQTSGSARAGQRKFGRAFRPNRHRAGETEASFLFARCAGHSPQAASRCLPLATRRPKQGAIATKTALRTKLRDCTASFPWRCRRRVQFGDFGFNEANLTVFDSIATLAQLSIAQTNAII